MSQPSHDSRSAPGPAPTRLWSARTAPFILSALALMTFIAIESFAVTTVLPVAMADLDGTTWYSLAFAATISTSLVGLVIGGNWSDRSGPRRPLIVGGTLFLLGLALCAVAPMPAVFIVGRALQGIGGGIDSVVLYVLIARTIPAPARPAMFGLLTTAWLLPSIAGPVVAGLLAQATSWRTVFVLILAGSALALLALLRSARGKAATDRDVPPTTTDGADAEEAADGGIPPVPTTPPPIVGRKGALALGAAGLLLVLHLGAQLQGLVGIVVVLLGLLALVLVARLILPPGTLRLRGLAQRLVVLRAGFGVASVVPDAYLTLYLQSERDLSPTLAGLILAMGAGGWALGSWVQSRVPSTQREHRRLILLAAPLVAVAPLGALLLTLDLVPIWAVVPAVVLKGLGMGIASARTATATLDLAPQREQGTYSSALQAGEGMAVAATTAVMATVLTASGSAAQGFVLVYAALVALAGLTILVAARTPRVGRSVAAAAAGAAVPAPDTAA